MRLLALVPLALVLSTPAAAQGWFEYENRVELFSVNFPAQPTETEIRYAAKSGAMMPARLFSALEGAKRYSVIVVNYTGAAASDVEAAIAHAAESIRRRNGTVTYDADAGFDGIDGHMLQLTNPDGSRSFFSIGQHWDRLYILEGVVPAGAPPPGQFQQSLGVLDQMGRRVRYNRDVDGNRFRVVPGTGGEPLLR